MSKLRGNKAARVPRIALTGGIASGKSTVAKLFAALGAVLIDTDQIARDIVAPPSAVLDRIAARFGAEILLPDGSLDRAQMRRLVFAEPSARKDLEAITHPAIHEEVARLTRQLGGPYQLIAVPLLVETGTAALYERVLLVDANPETQRRRLMLRDDVDASTRGCQYRGGNARGTGHAWKHAVPSRMIPSTTMATSDTLQPRSKHFIAATSPCGRRWATTEETYFPGLFMQNTRMSQEPIMAERAAAAAASSAPLIFEQPLNERMRTFLRLDYLYNQALYHNEKASQWGSRAAVASLIDILAITTRADVRSELLKEIEKHLAQLEAFDNHAGVDTGRLRALINNLARLRSAVSASGNSYLQPLRDSSSSPRSSIAVRSPAAPANSTCRIISSG